MKTVDNRDKKKENLKNAFKKLIRADYKFHRDASST